MASCRQPQKYMFLWIGGSLSIQPSFCCRLHIQDTLHLLVLTMNILRRTPRSINSLISFQTTRPFSLRPASESHICLDPRQAPPRLTFGPAMSDDKSSLDANKGSVGSAFRPDGPIGNKGQKIGTASLQDTKRSELLTKYHNRRPTRQGRCCWERVQSRW